MDTRTLILTASEWLGVIAAGLFFGLSPRFKRPPLVFVYPRREVLVSVVLFGLVLGMNFSLYRHGNADDLTLRLSAAGLALTPFALALLVRRQPLRSAGWNRALTGAALRAGLVLILLTIILRGRIFTLLEGVPPEKGQALPLVAGICLAEESIFRGYIQPRLKGWLGIWAGLPVTAAMFATWQLPRLLAAGSATNMLALGLGLALGQGLVLGWVQEKTGHVLTPFLYRTTSEWLSLLS